MELGQDKITGKQCPLHLLQLGPIKLKIHLEKNHIHIWYVVIRSAPFQQLDHVGEVTVPWRPRP
jgi:hypothetical protein